MLAEKVGFHVSLESRSVAAMRTLVRLLSSVNTDVSFQVSWGVEGGLVAVRADRGEVGEGVVDGCSLGHCGCWGYGCHGCG